MIKALRALDRRYTALPLWVRIIIALALFVTFVVQTQTGQICPAAVGSLLTGNLRSNDLPQGIEAFRVETLDGENLEVWKLEVQNSPHIALFFHGNGGTLDKFYPYQLWLAELGYTSYSFDYRGFGYSSGWPSQAGIKEDASSVEKFILEKEGITSEQLTSVGYSIGTAPAAYLASIHEPKSLVLLAPFTSIDAVVANHPFFRFFGSFLDWHLPTKTWVASLKKTCLLVAHGDKDTIIAPAFGHEVYTAYQGSGRKEFLALPTTNHNDILNDKDIIGEAILRCRN